MFGQERSEASQHGPKMMVMMMMMGGGEDNVVIDGDINHGGSCGRPGARICHSAPCPLSRHRAHPGRGRREVRNQDPDPGPRIQDHLSDQQQGRIQEKKWPGSVTQLRVRLAEEEEESGWSETRPRPGDAGGNHLSDPLPPSSAKFAYKRSSGETSDIRWLGLNRSWLSNRKILNTTVLSR